MNGTVCGKYINVLSSVSKNNMKGSVCYRFITDCSAAEQTDIHLSDFCLSRICVIFVDYTFAEVN